LIEGTTICSEIKFLSLLNSKSFIDFVHKNISIKIIYCCKMYMKKEINKACLSLL
jgi:hypothetical protein